MNVERLHRVVRLVLDELAELETNQQVQLLENALRAMSNSPSDTQAQQTLGAARTHLMRTLQEAPSNRWPPSDRQILEEIGISDVLGQALLDRIEEILLRNQMTPAVAADEVEPIRTRLDEAVAQLTTLVQALAFFGISRDDVTDEYEVGIAIPRREIGSRLPALGEDFIEWQKILAPFEELAGVGVADYEVRAISSSDFNIFLVAIPPVAYFILKAVNDVLDAYQKLLNIKKMRAEMAQEVPEERLSDIDEFVNEVMAQELRKAAADLVAQANVSDEGRKHELDVAVGRSLNKIANRIDSGYSIDIRTPPLPPEPEVPEEGEVDQAALGSYEQALEIAQLADRVKRLETGGSRILTLPEGDTPDPAAEK